jgi:hypothetical protein
MNKVNLAALNDLQCKTPKQTYSSYESQTILTEAFGNSFEISLRCEEVSVGKNSFNGKKEIKYSTYFGNWV